MELMWKQSMINTKQDGTKQDYVITQEPFSPKKKTFGLVHVIYRTALSEGHPRGKMRVV